MKVIICIFMICNKFLRKKVYKEDIYVIYLKYLEVVFFL